MKRTTCFAMLFCILASAPALAMDLYQWIDSRGVIHFTDNLNNVPATLRSSNGFTVRRNFLTPGDPAIAPALPPTPNPEMKAEPHSESALPSSAPQQQPAVHDAPQETTIIVVNSHSPRRAHRTCGGNNCPAAFRPNFNDRRYIHPSVFDGGSRQYIQP